MPNWVKCEVAVLPNTDDKDERIKKEKRITEFLYEEGADEFGRPNHFSLNKIIPMPVELNVDTDDKEERKNNLIKYGYMSWYEWRLGKWGCKWNTSDTELLNDGYWRFETPWSAPFKAMKELSKIFPECVFTLSFADEDIGYNCGERSYLNGEETLTFDPVAGSREAQAHAYELWGYDLDELEWDEEKKTYIDPYNS